MTETIHYKGYGICPTPYQLAETKEWALQIYIVRDTGHERRERQYSAANTFKTKDEAVAHCINLGRQIIDRKVENCSVDDL
jgi:hypothetical protein